MNKAFAQLISDYQVAVGKAILQISDSGIELPATLIEWLELRIPARGKLHSGAEYYKHGIGCAVYLPEGEVDFDFDQDGGIDGFDDWRLWKFCQSRPKAHAFGSLEEISNQVQHGLKMGWLLPSSHNLYFVADSVKLLGEDASRTIAAGCPLPHANRDSVSTLSTQCFDSASIMLDHYEAIDRRREKNQKLGQNDRVKFRVYLMSWLGYLQVTIEGFAKLNIRRLLQHKRSPEFLELMPNCDEIGRLQKRHADDLRVLRNDIFHLRTDNEAIRSFFTDGGERMKWAKELHDAFESFFSKYRVLSEVHRVLHGRLGESEIRQEGKRSRKKRALTVMS